MLLSSFIIKLDGKGRDKIKRITIITGHFGSGKTELAIFLASKMSFQSDSKIALCDLDVINPYFRSRDYEKDLHNNDIEFIGPKKELLKTDLPIVSGKVASCIHDTKKKVVIDVGGDKEGALSIGQFSRVISNYDYECIFVLNANRPYVSSLSGVKNTIKNIESASKVKVTGIVNNTHLGNTDFEPSDLIEGDKLAKQISNELKLTYLFSFVERKTWKRWVDEGITPELENIEIFERKLLTPWEEE
ncbi:hypothetical protein QA612_09015 [Evansella sp. AB-P1]|uniref:hypothetical protein n=1 Tax=Evansella sp. AB-P1 TaxID=3037653 RepID=UPI00241D3870|nr:hypothetical protein [Evansella sp. AB-P1]MDG5787636.1 hypothetical protein [Evansella sp. AB-P1]